MKKICNMIQSNKAQFMSISSLIIDLEHNQINNHKRLSYFRYENISKISLDVMKEELGRTFAMDFYLGFEPQEYSK